MNRSPLQNERRIMATLNQPPIRGHPTHGQTPSPSHRPHPIPTATTMRTQATAMRAQATAMRTQLQGTTDKTLKIPTAMQNRIRITTGTAATTPTTVLHHLKGPFLSQTPPGPRHQSSRAGRHARPRYLDRRRERPLRPHHAPIMA
jgi:hypothetical protein